VSLLARIRAAWRDACAANADIDDCQPMWPWFLCGFVCLALIALLFAGGLYFASRAHGAPSRTPTIEDPQ
jgi:hypothetical protein